MVVSRRLMGRPALGLGSTGYLLVSDDRILHWQFLHCCQFFWGGHSAGKLIDMNTSVERKLQLLLRWDADQCAKHFADSLQTLKGSDTAFRLWGIIIMDRIQNSCNFQTSAKSWREMAMDNQLLPSNLNPVTASPTGSTFQFWEGYKIPLLILLYMCHFVNLDEV